MGNFKAIAQFAPVRVKWHQANGVLPALDAHIIFTADADYELDHVTLRYAVAGGVGSTVNIRRVDSGTSISGAGSGANMIQSVTLTTTANTDKVAGLQPKDRLRLSPGQSLGLFFTTDLTGLSGLIVQARLRPLTRIKN